MVGVQQSDHGQEGQRDKWTETEVTKKSFEFSRSSKEIEKVN